MGPMQQWFEQRFSHRASHMMVLGAFGELFTDGAEEESCFKNIAVESFGMRHSLD